MSDIPELADEHITALQAHDEKALTRVLADRITRIRVAFDLRAIAAGGTS
jgi:hypothetical protein